MKKLSKTLSLVLCIIMVLSLVPISAFAETPTALTNITIQIDTPYVDTTPTFEAKIIDSTEVTDIANGNYSIKIDKWAAYDPVNVTSGGAKILRYEDRDLLPGGTNKFSENMHYAIAVNSENNYGLHTLPSGYTLSKDTKVTVVDKAGVELISDFKISTVHVKSDQLVTEFQLSYIFKTVSGGRVTIITQDWDCNEEISAKYVDSGEEVQLTAKDEVYPDEHSVKTFSHWEIEPNIEIEDKYSYEAYFYMPTPAVDVTARAVYASTAYAQTIYVKDATVKVNGVLQELDPVDKCCEAYPGNEITITADNSREFKEWKIAYSDRLGDNAIDVDLTKSEITFTMPDSYVRAFAYFNVPSCRVTYNSNGHGDFKDGFMYSYDVEQGSVLYDFWQFASYEDRPEIDPIYVYDDAYTGYQIDGCYTSPDCRDDELFDNYTPITSDITVYAKYNKKLFTIDGDTVVTAENHADILGDGTASYNPKTKTLTLNGYDGSYINAPLGINISLANGSTNKITVPAGADYKSAISTVGGLTLSGGGDLSIVNENQHNTMDAIYVEPSAYYPDIENVYRTDANIIIDMRGKLNINVKGSAGIFAHNTIDIFQCEQINIKSPLNCIQSINAVSINTNGKIVLESEMNSCIDAYGNITVDGNGSIDAVSICNIGFASQANIEIKGNVAVDVNANRFGFFCEKMIISGQNYVKCRATSGEAVSARNSDSFAVEITGSAKYVEFSSDKTTVSAVENLKIPNDLVKVKYQAEFTEDGSPYSNFVSYTNNYSNNDFSYEILDNGTVRIIGYNSSNVNVVIPSEIQGRPVTSIAEDTFYGEATLQSFSIPNTVKEIGIRAFCGTGYYNNEANWENGVLYIGDCLIEAKTTLTGNYSIKPGTRVIAEEAFNSCKITGVTIPSSVKNTGKCAFIFCKELNNVVLPDSLEYIDDMAFFDCDALASIKIPNSVKRIGVTAFEGCDALAEISLPSDVSIDGFGFSDTAYYKNEANWEDDLLYIGEYLISARGTRTSYSIKPGTKHIADQAFFHVSTIEELVIPNGVESIGVHAFYDCGELKQLTMPKSVKTIGKSAFYWCDLLANIDYNGTQEDWDKIHIEAENNTLSKAKLTHTHLAYTVKIDGVAQTASGDEFTFPVSTAKGFIAYTDGANYYDAGSKVAIDKDLEFTTVAIGEVKMLNGASIRLKEQSGIRFETQVDTTAFASLPGDAVVEKGTLITLKELATDELTLNSTFKTVNVKYLSDEYYKNENVFAGSIVGIKEKNIAKEFLGRGYVKVTVGDITKTIYADYADGDIANNSRSVAFVANAYKTEAPDLYNALEDVHKKLVDKWISKIS